MHVAEQLLAAEYVLKNNLKPKNGVLFVFNSCEEGLGNLKGIREITDTYGARMKEFIAFDGKMSAVVCRAVGSCRYKITVKTQGGHSYSNFGRPNAIVQLSQLVCKLDSIKIPQKSGCKTTMNVGTVQGGTSVNTIAQEAHMLFEFRSDDSACLAGMERQFSAIIAHTKAQGVDVSCEEVGRRPCMGDVDERRQQALFDVCGGIIRRHMKVEMMMRSGSTDCNIPWSRGIPSACVGGYYGGGAHTREEYLSVDSLKVGAEMVLDFVLSAFCLTKRETGPILKLNKSYFLYEEPTINKSIGN